MNNNNRMILWTELVAFDPDAADCGAGKYCDSLGFTPEAISLFVWGSDFVHLHDGMDADRAFPPDVGAYLDIYFEGPKVPGMVWTKYKLRTLVTALKQHGIKVLFSIFPTTVCNRFHREWVTDHPEVQNKLVGELKRDPAAINTLKRFADGTFYEDFLLQKVLEVMDDYGFDGWHLCDGYNHPWYQLWQADFSDDMLQQSGIDLPDNCISADDRAEYIWNQRRREWINFYVRRNTAYLKKVVDTLHAHGKVVTCHTAWARDPVDAIYRYGIDYRKLDELGFDSISVECVGSSGTTFDHLFRAHYGVTFENVVKATALLTRACIKKTPLFYMSSVQDMTEGYSSLRHFPGFLEREIFEYSHLGIWEGGKFHRCFAGRQVCLADGETPEEWRWLSQRWQWTIEDQVTSCDGAVLAWNDDFVDLELEAFMSNRPALTAPILYRLLSRGANIVSVVKVEELESVPGNNPILAINPGLWPEKDRLKLAQHVSTKVITAGIAQVPEGKAEKGDNGKNLYSVRPEPLNFFVEHQDLDLTQDEYDKILRELPDRFFEVLNADKNSDAKFYRFAAFQLDDGTWRVLVSNIHWQYIYGELVTTKPIANIVPVNEFRGRPFWLEKRPDGKSGNLIYLRVPPLGVAVVDVKFAD